MMIPMYGEYLEITTEIVMKALGCSRQYVSELVRKGVLKPSGRRGKSYTFYFSELGRVLDSQNYLKLVIRIDELLMANFPGLFERKRTGWRVRKQEEA